MGCLLKAHLHRALCLRVPKALPGPRCRSGSEAGLSTRLRPGGKRVLGVAEPSLRLLPAQGEIEAIVVPVCLAFLLLTLLGVLLCFNKRDL